MKIGPMAVRLLWVFLSVGLTSLLKRISLFVWGIGVCSIREINSTLKKGFLVRRRRKNYVT